MGGRLLAASGTKTVSGYGHKRHAHLPVRGAVGGVWVCRAPPRTPTRQYWRMLAEPELAGRGRGWHRGVRKGPASRPARGTTTRHRGRCPINIHPPWPRHWSGALSPGPPAARSLRVRSTTSGPSRMGRCQFRTGSKSRIGCVAQWLIQRTARLAKHREGMVQVTFGDKIMCDGDSVCHI